MGVRAGADTARVLGPRRAAPRAQGPAPGRGRRPRPGSPGRADAEALWFNQPLYAALAVDAAEALSASPRWHAALDVVIRSPLVTIDLVTSPPRRPRGGGLDGLGPFTDVRQLRLWDPLR